MIAPSDPHGQKIHLPTQANGTSNGFPPLFPFHPYPSEKGPRSPRPPPFANPAKFSSWGLPSQSHPRSPRPVCILYDVWPVLVVDRSAGGSCSRVRVDTLQVPCTLVQGRNCRGDQDGGDRSNPVPCTYPVLLPLKIRPEHLSGFAQHRAASLLMRCTGAALERNFRRSSSAPKERRRF